MIVKQGFHGVFLDTLDNAAYLERTDPVKYRSMIEGAARLVRTIRRHYPYLTIMINRAYELLPHIGAEIDMVAGESVRAQYDFEGQRYRRTSEKAYVWQVRQLHAAKKRHPKLKLFSLDYWDPEDAKGVAEIHAIQRKNGFNPYVSVLKLDRLLPQGGTP